MTGSSGKSNASQLKRPKAKCAKIFSVELFAVNAYVRNNKVVLCISDCQLSSAEDFCN